MSDGKSMMHSCCKILYPYDFKEHVKEAEKIKKRAAQIIRGTEYFFTGERPK